MANVGFKEVQAYAQTHNVDFKTAAKKLGLSEKEAADLEKLGGDPGAPEDGFKKTQYTINGKPVTLAHTFKLKSGRQVQVFKDAQGKEIFQYKAADGTNLKEAYFKKQEGVEGKRYVVMGNGQLGTVKDQTKPQEEKGWWDKTCDFVKENAGYIAAGTAVVGAIAGGVMCATGVGSAVGAPLLYGSLGVLGVGALSSCSKQSMTANFDIPLPSQQDVADKLGVKLDDLIKLLSTFGIKLDTLIEDNEEMKEIIKAILTQITSTNALLGQIKDDMNANDTAILKALLDIQADISALTNLVANLPADIKAEFGADLDAILQAIKTNGKTLTEIKDMLKTLGEKIIQKLDVNNDYQKQIKELLEKIQNGQIKNSEFIAQMLHLLTQIKDITGEINNKLDVVIDGLKALYAQNTNIQMYLAKIAEYIKKNNDKTDITNNLLQLLLDKSQNGGLTEAQLEAILKAISENGNKIDITNQLLADIKGGQEYILEAINKFGVDILNKMDVVVKMINNIGGSNNEDIKAALEDILKQLVKMDARQSEDTKAILDAIANIKIGGGGNGTVDLSSVEAMLAKLIELVGQNGKQLSDINAKLDVLNITAKAIEAKLDASNKDHKVIIDILNGLKVNGGNGYDDSKLLAILDLISNKLDDILAAIKDHDVKVTVDVTGKVTCDCNCGGNHEGILGDLEDLLG